MDTKNLQYHLCTCICLSRASTACECPLQMDESQEEAAHAHGDADQDYTTEVPEHLPKASRRIYSDAAPGVQKKGLVPCLSFTQCL